MTVSSVQNKPLKGDFFLYKKTVLYSYVFMDFQNKALHRCVFFYKYAQKHTCARKSESIKFGGGVINLLFLCLQRQEEMSEGCKIILAVKTTNVSA